MSATRLPQSEKAFQQAVVDAAKLCGWKVYHTYDSRRSEPGFPDLCMVRGGRLLFAELKSDRGEPSAAQLEWLSALSDVAHESASVRVFVWTPAMWREIEDVLR